MAKVNKEAAIIVGFLVFMIIIINLLLVWIQFNRFLFWFDIIFIPLSFIAILVCIINLLRVDDWEREDWYIIGAISGVVFLLTIVTISGAYNKGYSEEAIKTKAELEKMLEDYTFILSIYTGEFKLKVQEMVIDEFNKALCEAAPNTPCEQVIQSYNAYQELVGWKESADSLSKIWRKNKLL